MAQRLVETRSSKIRRHPKPIILALRLTTDVPTMIYLTYKKQYYCDTRNRGNNNTSDSKYQTEG